MKKILGRAAFGIMALTASIWGAVPAAQADTIVSATETHYDSSLRVDCVAARMNPSTFSNAPASACTLDAQGTYGPDRITHNVYDAAGQLSEVDQAYGVTTANGFPQTIQRAYARYTYGLVGQKTSEMDANGNMTTYIYDGFDRLSQIEYPLTTSGSGAANTADYETFQYDADNNKTVWRRRNGKTLYYNFDNLNRDILHYVSDGSVQNVYTGYDLQSHVLYARYGSTGGAGVTNVYDGLGRLSTTTDLNGRAISYLYDSASNRTRLTYPDGNYQPYTYDAANRVTLTTLGGGGISISYDGLGRQSTIGKGAAATSYGYDNLGRLTSMGNSVATSGDSTSWSFSYSPASQIVSSSASTTAFDYVETASTTTNNTYDGLNRDAGIAALNGGFDTNGNLTFDGTRTFTYDVYNHLLSETAAGSNLSLVYDPLGRLASQTYNGVATSFLYDGTNLVSEYNGSGAVTQWYVFGPGADEPLIWFQGYQISNPLYFIQDYHGSVIGYVDAGANVQSIYKYGPYGEPKTSSNVTSFAGARFRYTGQTVIPEASLYYYKARVYDPIFGRFLQTDPIGSKDDLDLYAYVGGDPINHMDPTGTDCVTTKGTTTCSGDGYKVSFPHQEGFQDFTTKSRNYHAYSVPANSNADLKTTQAYLKNNPTPGNPSPASAQGTRNDATPGVGGISPVAISPVTSFALTNQVDGKPVVVNVTVPLHLLSSGIVVREAVQTGNGVVISNRGEGTSPLQSPNDIRGFARDPINNVWQGLTPNTSPPPAACGAECMVEKNGPYN